MGCGCGGTNKVKAASLRWTVDLTGTGKTFADGTTKKTYMLVQEANQAVALLGLQGKVRPRPATVND